MDGLQAVVLTAVALFTVFMVGMQVVIRRRASAMRGSAAPTLPGALGKQVSGAGSSLLYFFSPTCAACRTITPRLKELRSTNAAIHLVDVSQDMEVAAALKVMATPTVVEIVDGKIASFVVGPPPADLLARFSHP
jgi:thiol-disulfide isomerase/thioredoxin